MRIGLFSDTYLPDINGVVTSVELLRKKLQERGHEVYVICTYPGLIKVQNEGNIIRLPGAKIKQLYGYAVASPLHPLLYDDIEALDLDLIHVHTEFGVGIFAELCADRFHIPLVRTYHTTYEDYTHYINFFDLDIVEKYGKKAVATLTKKLADRAMKMISPSKKTADMLRRYGVKTDIAIIPTGTELYRFKKGTTSKEKIEEIRREVGLKDDQKMILYVGRIAEEKSIDMLIEAFKIIKMRGAHLKLVVIGGGPDLEKLRGLADSYGLEDYVYFGDKRPFDEVPHYYHSASAFVSASITETQGMTYIEAMASGLVTFARHDESTVDLVKDGVNGYFFDDADELADKLISFSELDEKTKEKMGQVALEIADEYDADTFCDKILKVYDEAIREYDDMYNVDETKLKNDYIYLTLSKGDKTKVEVVVSLDDFYNMRIRKDEKLKDSTVALLRRKEDGIKAYRAALKRLAMRDYSVSEMRDYLKEHTAVDDEVIEAIITKLEERELLDDLQYATNKVMMFTARFMSKKKMVMTLKKVGIADEIIAKVIKDDEDEEYKKALKKAYYYQASIKNKSLKAKKAAITRHLYTDGFTSDIVDKALESLDMSADVMKESEVLRKEAYKVKKHYEKRYSGTELRNRIYRSLAGKGFSYDDIYAIINEME